MPDRIDFENAHIGEVEEVEDAFTGKRRSAVPEEHPLHVLFADSYDNKIGKRINTDTPELVEKTLKKIADQRDQSVRVLVEGNSVTFEASDKKRRASRTESRDE